MKTSAALFHPMRGNCEDGCEVVFSDNSVGIVGRDMNGWTFTHDGQTVRNLDSANDLTRHIVEIEGRIQFAP